MSLLWNNKEKEMEKAGQLCNIFNPPTAGKS